MIKGIQFLKLNHAGAMVLKNGQTVNYGVIRIDSEKVVYYTGQGLGEMWKPDMTNEEQLRAAELKKTGSEPDGEQKLIASGHIAVTPLDQIERINF